MPSPLPRRKRPGLFARTIPSSSAFPLCRRVGFCVDLFRGLLSVHSRLRPVRSPSRLNDPLHRRLRRLRCLRRRFRLLPGGANQFPGGSVPRCGSAPFTAHGMGDLSTRWGRQRPGANESVHSGWLIGTDGRGRLFLSGLVSTRARLRFTGCDQYAASKGDAVGSRIAKPLSDFSGFGIEPHQTACEPERSG